MGKVFFFVTLVILGIVGLLFLANSQIQTTPTPVSIPTIAPQQPTPTQQTAQAPTTPPQPTANLTPTASSSAESFLQEIATKSAVIKTSKGDITISFYAKDTINTVYNFVSKAQGGFYNNLTFHRVEDWVVQGGDPLGNGTGGGNMPVEFNNKPFVVGSVGMASHGDGKVQNDAQFFITKKESSWLNGQYTNFGIVKKGMDVANKIEIGDKILGITVE